MIEVSLKYQDPGYSMGPTTAAGDLRIKPPELLAGDPEAVVDLKLSLPTYSCQIANTVQSYSPADQITVREMGIIAQDRMSLRAGQIDLARFGYQVLGHTTDSGHDVHSDFCPYDLWEGRIVCMLPRSKPLIELLHADCRRINLERDFSCPDDFFRRRLGAYISDYDLPPSVYAEALRIDAQICALIKVGGIRNRDQVAVALRQHKMISEVTLYHHKIVTTYDENYHITFAGRAYSAEFPWYNAWWGDFGAIGQRDPKMVASEIAGLVPRLVALRARWRRVGPRPTCDAFRAVPPGFSDQVSVQLLQTIGDNGCSPDELYRALALGNRECPQTEYPDAAGLAPPYLGNNDPGRPPAFGVDNPADRAGVEPMERSSPDRGARGAEPSADDSPHCPTAEIGRIPQPSAAVREGPQGKLVGAGDAGTRPADSTTPGTGRSILGPTGARSGSVPAGIDSSPTTIWIDHFHQANLDYEHQRKRLQQQREWLTTALRSFVETARGIADLLRATVAGGLRDPHRKPATPAGATISPQANPGVPGIDLDPTIEPPERTQIGAGRLRRAVDDFRIVVTSVALVAAAPSSPTPDAAKPSASRLKPPSRPVRKPPHPPEVYL